MTTPNSEGMHVPAGLPACERRQVVHTALERHARRRARRFKGGARRQFHGWAESYDRSPLNALLFRPSYLALMEEIALWRRNRGLDSPPSEGDDVDGCREPSFASHVERREIPAAGGTRDGPFTLLDVGCGTGSFASMLARSPWPVRITALDYVQTMCRSTRDKLREHEHTDIINGDSEHLPFPARTFDVVTCSHSFHHYPHQRAVIGEMFRVLRSGGLLVLIDGFRDNVIGWTVYDVVVSRLEKNVFHAPWSLVRRYMLEAGFSPIRQRKINVLLPALVTAAEVPPASVA